MIELVDFQKKYDKFSACENVNFLCKDCKITGLLGPNGAGKSTIIKAICGVHYPSSGKILVDGISVEENTVEAQKLIGYVSESRCLYPFDNVPTFFRKTSFKSIIEITFSIC